MNNNYELQAYKHGALKYFMPTEVDMCYHRRNMIAFHKPSSFLFKVRRARVIKYQRLCTIARIKVDLSTAVARRLKPSRAIACVVGV